MLRRIHILRLSVGELPLDPAAAHYARDVLRLPDGAEVEAFDDLGATADARLVYCEGAAAVRIETIRQSPERTIRWTVAAAVPKGDRADWMIEKLSELGTDSFIPLAAARSVVLPGGENKRQRWIRISTEAARQSRRIGVMHIGELTKLEDLVRSIAAPTVGWYCSTDSAALPMTQKLNELDPHAHALLLVGPEGGWTPEETQLFEQRGLKGVRLTSTVLRVETAAVLAAGLLAASIAKGA